MEKEDRTDRLLPIVSNSDEAALPIISDAHVLSSFLHAGKTVRKDSGVNAACICLCSKAGRCR